MVHREYFMEKRKEKIAKYGPYKVCCGNCGNEKDCLIHVSSAKGDRVYQPNRVERRLDCKSFKLDKPQEMLHE